ncbi:hypothetical protein ACRAWF_46305 [Streptomyces sp. L7]
MHTGAGHVEARSPDYQGEPRGRRLQILERTLEPASRAGILVNGGDPKYPGELVLRGMGLQLGIQPTAAFGNTTGCTPSPTCTGPDGTRGLGWANNPANPDYPPTRAPYLKTSYADASHPADWPYQERIMGWTGPADPALQHRLIHHAGLPRRRRPGYRSRRRPPSAPRRR